MGFFKRSLTIVRIHHGPCLSIQSIWVAICNSENFVLFSRCVANKALYFVQPPSDEQKQLKSTWAGHECRYRYEIQSQAGSMSKINLHQRNELTQQHITQSLLYQRLHRSSCRTSAHQQPTAHQNQLNNSFTNKILYLVEAPGNHFSVRSFFVVDRRLIANPLTANLSFVSSTAVKDKISNLTAFVCLFFS